MSDDECPLRLACVYLDQPEADRLAKVALRTGSRVQAQYFSGIPIGASWEEVRLDAMGVICWARVLHGARVVGLRRRRLYRLISPCSEDKQ